MKKLCIKIIICGMCFSISALNAQINEDYVGKTYITTEEISTEYSSPYKDFRTNTIKADDSVRKGVFFEIVNIEDDCNATIRISDYKKGQTADVVKYQKVSLKQLMTSSKPATIKNGFMFGTLVLPIKLRPGYGNREFEFTKDVSFSATGAYRFRFDRVNPYYFAPMLGIGITSVGIDSINTQGKIRKTQDIAAFSITTGILFEFNKIQVGAFMGVDLLSQNSKYGWVNQGLPWFSIGIGYQIFSINVNNEQKNKAKK